MSATHRSCERLRATLGVTALALAGCGGSVDESAAPAPAGPVAAAVSAEPRAAPPEAEARASAPETLAEVHRELASLRSEVADLRRRLDQSGPGLPGAGARPVGDIPSSPSESERLGRAEAAFRMEAIDPAWSRSAMAQVRAAVAAAGGATAARLRNVECRTRTCRIDLAPDLESAADDALPSIVAELGAAFTRAEGIHLDQGDGRQAGLIFLIH